MANSARGIKVSVLCICDTRYEGDLCFINAKDNTFEVRNVRLMGTEGRRGDPNVEIPPAELLYEFLIFRRVDIKALALREPLPQDPAMATPALGGPRSAVSACNEPPQHDEPSTASDSGGKELWEAAAARNVDECRSLLAAGAPVDFVHSREGTFPLSETALGFAAWSGHLDVVALLLANGANIDALDELGRTPLSCAVAENHLAVVSLLLAKGASVDYVRDRKVRGFSPLVAAVGRGHLAVAAMLLEKGANADIVDPHGTSPLAHAALRGHTAIAALLLEKGASITKVDRRRDTPLSLAAQQGHIAVAALLLEKGATVDSVNSRGCTPLTVAAFNGHSAVVSLLLERGASVEEFAKRGETPLRRGAGQGHTAVVALLLNHSAAFNRQIDPRAFC